MIRLTHRNRCRGPLYRVLVLSLVFPCPSAFALELRLGGELSYSEYTLEGQGGDETSLEPLGPAISLGLSDDAGWFTQLRFTDQDDSRSLRGDFALSYDLETWGFQAGYSWPGDTGGRTLAFFWQRDREKLRLDNSANRAPITEPVFLEDTRTHGLSIELTQFWYWEAWSPSLSAGLIGLNSDTERQFRQGPDSGFILTGEGEDTLKGLDGALSARLDYMLPVSGSSVIAPYLGLSYQRSLSGDISRSTTTGLISRRGRRAFSSEDSSQTLEGEDQLSLQGGVSWMFGPWTASFSFAQPLLTEPLDPFLVLEISHRWELGD